MKQTLFLLPALALLTAATATKDLPITVTPAASGTIHATQYCAANGGGDGSAANPWHGACIVAAINAAPSSGTVIVDNGTWRFDTDLVVTRGNFTVQGASLSAQLIFTTGTLKIGVEGTNIANVTISGLTIDQSGANLNALQAIQLWQCDGCALTGNVLYGHSNGSVAVFIAFGGSNGQITGNKIISKAAGGNQLQINPLGNPLSTNSGFLVANNQFDSVGLLLIGTDNIHVTQNHFGHHTLGNFIAMVFAATGGVVTHDILIDYNVLDATEKQNGAVLSGIPQDPSQGGAIQNVTIDHNTVNSTGSVIAANDFEPSCLATCSDISHTSNIKITNNTANSLWGGSIIDISGGISGSVNGALVTGNVLSNSCAQHPALCGGQSKPPNLITKDAHTTNAVITGNTL
jgi:hypothetical protein